MSIPTTLDGSVALVTGASRGIGRAIAVRLGALGARVVVAYRSDEAAAAETCRRIEGGARPLQVDVGVPAQATAMVDEVRSAEGRIDILVNNAGIQRSAMAHRMSDDDWHDVIAVNLSAVFFACRAALPTMREQRSGHIVNVASASAFVAQSGAGELRRVQARPHRSDEGAGRRERVAGHPHQRGGAGAHRHRHGAWARRRAACTAVAPHPPGSNGRARRGGACRELARHRGFVHDGQHPAHERRGGAGMIDHRQATQAPLAPRSPAADDGGTAAEEFLEAIVASDVYFGGFCVVMLIASSIGWWFGLFPGTAVIALLAFVLGNAVVSQLSMVASRAGAVEVGRAVVFTVLAPAAYVFGGGPTGPWWPGFLIMALGGSVVWGLLTGRPRYGRLVVAYYVGLMFLTAWFFVDGIDWLEWTLEASVIAMTGLLFATIMSMLGRQFHKERERASELQHARDALFAEVEVAQEIQTLLLPAAPQIPDHDVVGRMIPADEVGGDYYDVISVGGRQFLAVGDVSGHGVTAGLTMMMVRSSLIGVLEGRPDATLAAVFLAVNRCIVRNLSRMGVRLHMTFNLLEYTGQGHFVAVGQHLPILIYRRATSTVEEVETTGAWLGILADLPPDLLAETRFELSSGDLLALYTDGIVEQLAGDEMFGFERLSDIVRTHAENGPQAVIDAMLWELQRFAPGRANDDDITMLVLHHRGEASRGGTP